jgi:hypothetical protein
MEKLDAGVDGDETGLETTKTSFVRLHGKARVRRKADESGSWEE